MPTAAAVLDPTQYVRINSKYTSMVLQAHGDAVRVVLSETKPAVSNEAFHLLKGGDEPFDLRIVDTNVWVLATTTRANLVVTEYRDAMSVRQVLLPSMFNEYAHQHTGVSSTLAVATPADGSATSIEVVNGAIFTVTDSIQISNGTTELTFAQIQAIAGNVLTLDRRIDNAHPIGTTVEKVIFDLSVAGTLAAPQEYIIKPEGTSVCHVERLVLSMVHPTAGDMGLFGNLNPLPNGVLIRSRIDGKYRTLTNWKTNDEIKDDAYELLFNQRSGGGGSYGTSALWALSTFGVEVRLDAATNDQLEIYVQDDLSLLTHFSVKAQGHYEVE